MNQRGSASLLTVGFFLVVALTVGVVVDASAAYLQRQALANLADAAALAAADGVKADQVYAAGVDAPASIDEAAARRHAAAYLDQVRGRATYPGLRVEVGVIGQAITVRLAARVDLPISPPGWEDKPLVSAESAAFVVVGE